jgi:hypothetical protein
MNAEPRTLGRGDLKRLHFSDGTHIDAERVGGVVRAMSDDSVTARVHWPSVALGERVLVRTWLRWSSKPPTARHTATLVRTEVLR